MTKGRKVSNLLTSGINRSSHPKLRSNQLECMGSSLSETMPQHVHLWHMKQYPYFQKILENSSQNHFFNPFPICLSNLKNPYFHYILHVSIFLFTFFIPLYISTQYIDMIPHMQSTMYLASFDVYCGCTSLHPQ